MSKEVYIKLINDFLIHKVYPNISYNIRSILNIYDDLRFHTEVLQFMDKDNKDISIELHIIQDYKDREDIDLKNIFDYKYQCYLKENSSYEELSKLSKLEDSKLNIKENHHSIRYFNDEELKLLTYSPRLKARDSGIIKPCLIAQVLQVLLHRPMSQPYEYL